MLPAATAPKVGLDLGHHLEHAGGVAVGGVDHEQVDAGRR
jgi:hypothetical protein